MIKLASRTLLATAIAAIAFATPALAQKTTQTGPGRGGSVHVKSEWTVKGANIVIEYGRPSLKGRDEMKLMRTAQPWRTGADEASTITTDKALTFGSVTLKPGTYTINTVQNDKDWHIVFGTLKAPGQWGVPYQKDLELSRAPMKTRKLKKAVELVTFSIDPTKTGGTLRIEWGKAGAAANFTVGS